MISSFNPISQPCSPGRRPEANEDPHICASCAKKSDTCCHIEPENAELCFPLSEPEAARLKDYLGESLCLGEAPNSSEFLTVMVSLFPGESPVVHSLFPPDKNHATLGTDAKGFCLHLGPDGCELPRELRPWFCRLFPFWVSRGEITTFAAPYCLAHRQSISLRGMLRKIDQNEADVREIYNNLRLDWGFVPALSGTAPGEGQE